MIITREWCMPNKNTFEIKPIKLLIDDYINKLPNEHIIVDPFANKNKYGTITNDIDPQYNTTYNLDAIDFLKLLQDNSCDMVLYDTPYSPRQISECYKKMNKSVNMTTTQASYWSKQKEQISRIIKNNGYVISFSWNSGGIGKKIWL